MSFLCLYISNLLNATDSEKINIEVLANSEAVKYYDISQDLDIVEFVDIVPTGVLELIKKQSEGYAYIKP